MCGGLNYRKSKEEADEVVNTIKEMGGKAIAVKCDVSKRDEVVAMFKATVKEYGKVDILVNNAGVGVGGSLLETTDEVWDRHMAVNLKGVFLCSQVAARYMVERKYGRVVSIGTDAARTGDPAEPIYAGAKGAIIAWNKSLALDQGRNGITFNVICPALTTHDQESFAQFVGGPEKVQEILTRFYPLRKFGTPQEVAAMVVFVASEKGSHITGQTISVNGGFYLG